jgi:hypothetical protein
MTRMLHVITRPEDALAGEMIAAQQKDTALEIRVIDLSQGAGDYAVLLEEIFRADSVEVW